MPGQTATVRRLVPRMTALGYGNRPRRTRSRRSWRSREGIAPIWASLLRDEYEVDRPEDLTLRQASELIDLLKAPAEA